MKLLLLGATGRTGKLVLTNALKKGYEVNCLVRNAFRLKQQKGVSVIEGDVNNISDIQKAIQDCKAVINVLNISRTSDFPWARLRTPETFLSDVMSLVIKAAYMENVNRIVTCSAWGTSETIGDIPIWFRWLINSSNIGITYRDHERQENMLLETDLNWTIVRPVGLINSTKKEQVKETFGKAPKPSLIISRLTVAEYLVNSLNRNDLIRKKVVISKY